MASLLNVYLKVTCTNILDAYVLIILHKAEVETSTATLWKCGEQS